MKKYKIVYHKEDNILTCEIEANNIAEAHYLFYMENPDCDVKSICEVE